MLNFLIESYLMSAYPDKQLVLKLQVGGQR